jgi:DinB superfamily
METTLNALAGFPATLAAHYAQIPASFENWSPPCWHGIPSEPFTALAQLCHLRDIELDGYHVRLRRTLAESEPTLESIDGERLAVERSYASEHSEAVLEAFRRARSQTLHLLSAVEPSQLERTAHFAEHGVVTLRSLVHLLCSHDQQHLAGLQWLLARIRSATPAPR